MNVLPFLSILLWDEFSLNFFHTILSLHPNTKIKIINKYTISHRQELTCEWNSIFSTRFFSLYLCVWMWERLKRVPRAGENFSTARGTFFVRIFKVCVWRDNVLIEKWCVLNINCDDFNKDLRLNTKNISFAFRF